MLKVIIFYPISGKSQSLYLKVGQVYEKLHVSQNILQLHGESTTSPYLKWHQSHAYVTILNLQLDPY